MKPFNGVISGWYRDVDVICGKCQWHADALEQISVTAMLNNLIVRGHDMHTSRIEKIEDRGVFAMCETKNSFYILVQPRVFAAAPHEN